MRINLNEKPTFRPSETVSVSTSAFGVTHSAAIVGIPLQRKKSRVQPDEPAEILKNIAHESLAKGEIEGVSARIEKFDLERSVYNWSFLSDELIEPGLPNFARAVGSSVNALIFAGSGAIQCHLKADGLTVLRRS